MNIKTRTFFQPLLLALLATFVAAGVCHAEEAWKTTLNRELPLMGYHNWIVVADAAYPWQTAPGIETVVTGADHLTVVRAVLEALSKTKHVRPLVRTGAELQYLSEQDAPSITAYREELSKLVGPDAAQPNAAQPNAALPHERLIGSIAEAGQNFHVLLLKTKGTLPYSSVFVQLNAAYWNPEAEQRLRAAMPSAMPAVVPSSATGGGPASSWAPDFRGPGAGPQMRDAPPFPPRPRGRRGGG